MRLRATHSATVYGERVIGEDELGTELTKSDAPVLECPARFKDQSRNVVRKTTGEHVEQRPSAVLPPYGYDPQSGERVLSVDRVEPGHDIEFSAELLKGEATGQYSIESISIARRRGNRLEALDCQLTRHD